MTAAAESVYRSALISEARVGSAGFLAAAVALHVVVVGAAFWLPTLLQSPAKIRKPVIAKLVALGKPRPKGMLPRKESAPAVAAAPSSRPALRPSADSRSSRSARSKDARRQPTRQELMRRALALAGAHAGVERERDDRRPEEREGTAEGSVQGTAATAEEGDKYFTAVHDAILQNYVLPSVISERERLYLKATLLAFIGPDGSLLRHQILKASGNALFDQALELALQKTHLPAPPRELAKALRDEGVELNFKP